METSAAYKTVKFGKVMGKTMKSIRCELKELGRDEFMDNLKIPAMLDDILYTALQMEILPLKWRLGGEDENGAQQPCGLFIGHIGIVPEVILKDFWVKELSKHASDIQSVSAIDGWMNADAIEIGDVVDNGIYHQVTHLTFTPADEKERAKLWELVLTFLHKLRISLMQNRAIKSLEQVVPRLTTEGMVTLEVNGDEHYVVGNMQSMSHHIRIDRADADYCTKVHHFLLSMGVTNFCASTSELSDVLRQSGLFQ